MLRIDNHFDDLFFTETVLSRPVVLGNTIRVPVTGLFPLKNHPLLRITDGPISGALVFDRVINSKRILIEYIGNSRKPLGFREPREENDGPFPPLQLEVVELHKFYVEGFWKSPPAWVDSWLIEAHKFTLEVTEHLCR